MSNEKRYPLSEEKRRKLRERGIYPRSTNLITFAALVGVFIGLSLLRYRWADIGGEKVWKEMHGQGEIASVVTSLWSIVDAVMMILFPCIFFVFLASGFQSRFLMARSGGRRVSRLRSEENLLERVSLYGAKLLVYSSLLAVVAVAGTSLWGYSAIHTEAQSLQWQKFFTSSWSGTGHGQEAAKEMLNTEWNQSFQQPLRQFSVLVLSALAVVAALSLVLAQIKFREKYRMTREEAESEFREAERSGQSGRFLRSRESDSADGSGK